MVSGIPEYDIPSLEPIDLGDLIVAGSRTGEGLSITAKDIKAYGAGNYVLKNLKYGEDENVAIFAFLMTILCIFAASLNMHPSTHFR